MRPHRVLPAPTSPITPDCAGRLTAPAGADEVFEVPTLRDDVEILVDRWGVPHIYAQHRLDAYVAQGFQAARDRLFQIDLWRRRGLGQLAEVLGPDQIEADRARRLFLYRGDMRAEWLAYNTATRDIVTAFVSGVNAYVDWALQEPGTRLPPEFAALGYRPAHWAPEDVVRIRTHGLLYNVEQELARALTLRDLGPRAEELRAVREPAAGPQVPDTTLFDDLSEEVLADYRLAFAPVDFQAGTSAEGTTASGSNNWVVSPARSATGRPVLANDPHRAVTLPSLRYLAHLDAPGLSVIGAGEPSLPGIPIGHNEHVAFGLTIWPADQEDLYVYELHPHDDARYLCHGAWEHFRVVRERAPVRDGEDVVHTLAFTRHGPVVHIDTQARRAVAVRAAWLEPGMAPYLGSLEYQDARYADDFRQALSRWGAPGANQVFATVDGDIGWQASAMIPHRPGWDGSVPVPGDGTHEWDGFVPTQDLPSVLNPLSGWFATANQCNLPEGDRTGTPFPTTDWYSGARHERLSAWLDSGEPVDVEASLDMQTDALNLHGRRLLDRLAAVVPNTHRTEWAELQAWDGTEDKQSRAALLFQVWQRRHLRPWLVDQCLERLGTDPTAARTGRHRLLREDSLFSDLRPDLRMLDLFDPDNPADNAALQVGVETTMGSALAELEQLLGHDRTRWTWGALHRTTLRHPVLAGRDDMPAGWGTLPSVARSGSGDTVGLSGYDASFNAVMGSSFRMVLDVGDWDKSRVINSPGQSGDPRSPHHADLLPLWAADQTFPLLYSREAVKAHLSRRTLLAAARPRGAASR